jgi:acyl-coenzyme A synthetase/AMP-(fatty) acid ligase
MSINADDLTVGTEAVLWLREALISCFLAVTVGLRFCRAVTVHLVQRYQPTILTTVPTAINSMLNVNDVSPADLASFGFVTRGRSITNQLYDRWMKHSRNICDGIGSAEMFHLFNRPGDIKPGSLKLSMATRPELLTPREAKLVLEKWEHSDQATRPRSVIGTLIKSRRRPLLVISVPA